MIFNRRHLVTGVQAAETYTRNLKQLAEGRDGEGAKDKL